MQHLTAGSCLLRLRSHLTIILHGSHGKQQRQRQLLAAATMSWQL
jgi:hypothetical protein